MNVLTVVFCFSTIFGSVYGHKNKSAGYILYENLIFDQGYNLNVRPIVNTSVPITVNVSLTLISLIEFDEVSEILTITAKLKFYWYDEYLTWDPAMYNGLQAISIPQSNVWKPDIALENSVERYHDLGSRNMYVAVAHDGRIQWKPIEVLRSTCSADVTKYPLDIQNCCLHFEAWSHIKGSVKITNHSENVILHAGYDGHPQWQILETNAKAKTIGDDDYVIFCITIKRQSNYVMLNIILPISLLSLLNNCVFLLPVSCGEKVSFSVTVFLALSVFLTMVSEQLPNASDKVAMFNLYVFIQVVISTMVTMTTLLQIRLFYRDNGRKVPAWLRSLVSSCGQFSKSNRNDVDVMSSKTEIISTKATHSQTSEKEKGSEANSNQVTWRHVADWMDPVMFVGYVALNILCTFILVGYSVSI